MSVTNLQDWQQERENQRLDAEYERIARQQGKTVEQLDAEYMDHFEKQLENDPEFKAWMKSQISGDQQS